MSREGNDIIMQQLYDEIRNEESFEAISKLIHGRTEAEWFAYYKWLQDKKGSLVNRMFHHGFKIFLYPIDRIANNSRYITYGKKFYFSKPYQIRWEGSRCKEYVTQIDFYDSFYKDLGDSKSQKVMISLLKYALTDDEKIFSEIDDSDAIPQYFDSSIVVRGGRETFLDCGAFIGDTVLDYMKYYGSDEDTIISFELDDANASKYYENTKLYTNIRLIKKGVWDCHNIMHCDSERAGARVTERTTEKIIEVDTIDSMINVAVDFIKMDIEGAEEKALKGAAQHISRDTPKLAICIYHKVDDIRVLSQTINSIKDGYKFYLRHYSDTSIETVMYGKYGTK